MNAMNHGNGGRTTPTGGRSPPTKPLRRSFDNGTTGGGGGAPPPPHLGSSPRAVSTKLQIELQRIQTQLEGDRCIQFNMIGTRY